MKQEAFKMPLEVFLCVFFFGGGGKKWHFFACFEMNQGFM